MSELEVDAEGRYLGGDVPFGYTLWGDHLVEVPAELDACVTMIRMTREGHGFEAILAAVRDRHGVAPTRAQYDGLLTSVRRRYGPI